MLGGLPERDPMDFVTMEAGEVATGGKTWADQERELSEGKNDNGDTVDGADAMDEDGERGDGDESMEVCTWGSL